LRNYREIGGKPLLENKRYADGEREEITWAFSDYEAIMKRQNLKKISINYS